MARVVGGHALQGACMVGGMHGRGACVAMESMHGRGVCMGGHVWRGGCVTDTTRYGQ